MSVSKLQALIAVGCCGLGCAHAEQPAPNWAAGWAAEWVDDLGVPASATGDLGTDAGTPQPRVKPAGLPTSTAAASPQDTAEDIWRARCSMCHGRDGSAQTPAAKRNKVRDLTDPQWQASLTDRGIREVIRFGVADTRMRGFDGKVSDAQLDALTRWLRGLVRSPATASR